MLAAALVAACCAVSATAAPPTLERGDRGPSVRRLQRALHLSADGVFGRDTVRAVADTAQQAATSAAASMARWRRSLGTKPSTLPSEILLFAGSLAGGEAAAHVSAAEWLERHVDPDLPAEHALRRDLRRVRVAP